MTLDSFGLMGLSGSGTPPPGSPGNQQNWSSRNIY